MAKNREIVEIRVGQKARNVARELKAVRRAVEILAECDYGDEVGDELKKLPASERAAFVALAAEAVQELSAYIEAAGGAPEKDQAIAV